MHLCFFPRTPFFAHKHQHSTHRVLCIIHWKPPSLVRCHFPFIPTTIAGGIFRGVGTLLLENDTGCIWIFPFFLPGPSSCKRVKFIHFPSPRVLALARRNNGNLLRFSLEKGRKENKNRVVLISPEVVKCLRGKFIILPPGRWELQCLLCLDVNLQLSLSLSLIECGEMEIWWFEPRAQNLIRSIAVCWLAKCK